MFVDVPISVQVPPKSAAKEIGINNFPGLILVSLQTVKAMGNNNATTAVSFIKAEKIPEIPQNTIRAMR